MHLLTEIRGVVTSAESDGLRAVVAVSSAVGPHADELVASSVAITIDPGHEVLWIGDDTLGEGTHLSAVLERAPGKDGAWLACDVMLDNTSLKPFRE